MINKHEKWKKRGIVLGKELDEVNRELRNKKVKSVTPFQDGWTISLNLREEDLRRADINDTVFLVNFLKKDTFTRNVELVKGVRRDHKFSSCEHLFYYKGWDGTYSYNGPHLASLTEKKFQELEDKYKKYFTRIEKVRVGRWGGVTYTEVTYKFDIPKHMLVMKVTKRIVKEIVDIDPELVAKESYLGDELKPYWRESPHYGGWHKFERRYENKRRRIHQNSAIKKFLKNDIDDIKNHNKLKRLE